MSSRKPPRAIAPVPGDNPFGADISLKPQTKRTSTACLQCRKKRVKCDGTSPCNACRLSGADCVIDKEGDGRRKIVLKRKIDSLEQDNKLLLRAFNTLRETDEEKALELLRLIRSNVSLGDICSRLDIDPGARCLREDTTMINNNMPRQEHPRSDMRRDVRGLWF
ncbi:hypothetical protein BJY04DRAFT_187228 [Aspergillus karnatakaensis]|uniref:Zn(II)2Cys6 transcription factor domain-containing protein n=1 Tax=Aspergillus karnatakaensis TaxID=1810916 RepID=UPI003CCD1F84